MIKATGIGRLAADAELRNLPDGTPVLSWRMAFNGAKKDAPATWVSCSIFGKRGESLAPHLTKGSQLCVSGTLSTREYESKGEKRLAVEIRVDDVAFAGDKKEDAPKAAYGKSGHGANAKHTAPSDDDVPF